MHKYFIVLCILFYIPKSTNGQSLDSFVEFGTTLFTGDYVPLWQNSLQHGFSSLDNNVYIRGGAFYKKQKNFWNFDAGVDIGFGAGFRTVANVQQAYLDVRYKWIGAWAGCKELESPLLNQQLTSGGLTWSGNSRPIPQVAIGIFDYIHLTRWLQFKAEMSYGWFTDSKYQHKYVGSGHSHVHKVKYHHKSFFFKIGNPNKHWMFDIGLTFDDQFGGYFYNNKEVVDMGNNFKNYINAFFPKNGGEGIYFDGNYLGSEHFKLTYDNDKFSVSAYLENYFDDLSGMAKQNGFDGLWGIEFKTDKFQAINGLVLEYYQSTNQSGPMHGIDFTEIEKTGGADDYYNHFAYSGWEHAGMGNGTPLVAAPIYNKDGNLSFLYNRVKAIHIGWRGDITDQLNYRAKMTYNRTWGTPFLPTADILDNFSTFVELRYFPKKLHGWKLTASASFDIGDIYGDNLGVQIKIRKRF